MEAYIIITSIAYLFLTFWGDKSFNIYNIREDINNIIFAGKDIYYGYQLWYVNTQLKGYILFSILQEIITAKEKKKKYLYLIVITVILACLVQYYYLSISIGILFGNIAKDFPFNKVWKKITITLVVVLTPFIPTIHALHSQTWQNEIYCWGIIVTSIYYAIFMAIGTFLLSKKIVILNLLSNYTFHFYLVHVLVISLYVKSKNYLKYSINVIVEFGTIFLICVILSIIYEKITSKMCNYLYKKIVRN